MHRRRRRRRRRQFRHWQCRGICNLGSRFLFVAFGSLLFCDSAILLFCVRSRILCFECKSRYCLQSPMKKWKNKKMRTFVCSVFTNRKRPSLRRYHQTRRTTANSRNDKKEERVNREIQRCTRTTNRMEKEWEKVCAQNIARFKKNRCTNRTQQTRCECVPLCTLHTVVFGHRRAYEKRQKYIILSIVGEKVLFMRTRSQQKWKPEAVAAIMKIQYTNRFCVFALGSPCNRCKRTIEHKQFCRVSFSFIFRCCCSFRIGFDYIICLVSNIDVSRFCFETKKRKKIFFLFAVGIRCASDSGWRWLRHGSNTPMQPLRYSRNKNGFPENASARK